MYRIICMGSRERNRMMENRNLVIEGGEEEQ
jgi:hypothetical protein